MHCNRIFIDKLIRMLVYWMTFEMDFTFNFSILHTDSYFECKPIAVGFPHSRGIQSVVKVSLLWLWYVNHMFLHYIYCRWWLAVEIESETLQCKINEITKTFCLIIINICLSYVFIAYRLCRQFCHKKLYAYLMTNKACTILKKKLISRGSSKWKCVYTTWLDVIYKRNGKLL